MDVYDLFATLSLDSSQYDEGLDSSKEKASNFSQALGTTMKVGAAAVAAVGTAVVGVGAAFTNGVADLASYGDNIDKMSQKMGISAEKYQEWDAVMQHSGTSMESMKASMKTLANAVENGNEAFEKIGLTQEQLATMSQEDIFEATIAGLQNVEDTTERTYLAGQLLGRGATELGALLNTSAEETQAMKDRVHELGGVMSDDAVKASAKYQDTLQDMTTAFQGLKRGMMSDFLPSITTVMDGLTSIFTGNYDEGLEQISEGVTDTVNNITEILPQLTEIGGEILSTLIDAISENLPTLLESGIDIVMKIGDAIISNLPAIMTAGSQVIMKIAESLIQNLPMIVKTGLAVIVQLAQSIGASLPTLIPTIVDVVLEIVDTLIENIDMLIDAAISIIMGLAEGLIEALPRLLEKAPEIIGKLVEAIINNAPKLLDSALELIVTLAEGIISNVDNLLDACDQIISKIVDGLGKGLTSIIDVGKNLIKGLWEGINDMAEWVYNKITGLGETIIDKVKGIFGVASPSKVFAEIGGYLAEGLGDGWEDGIDTVNKQIEKDMDYKGSIDMTVQTGVTSSGSTLTENDIERIIGALTINLYNTTEVDGEVINEKSYQYTVGRFGSENRAIRLAHGGTY